MKIYLDNAATTPLDPTVFKAMTPYLLEQYGNPSAHHGHGREARKAIDTSRASIAKLLNASPEEIIFTSGGTEADNIAIVSAITCGQIDHVITTRFEHHAVLNTLKSLSKKHNTRVSFVKHDADGNLDLADLEYLLRTNTRNLVSIMHANNEIGNLNDIEKISGLCDRYNALFHTDTVQTMGHYTYDLSKLKIHFLAASAHKFHGPKGVGFLYCRKGNRLTQLIHGGGQENSNRAGTENIPGIVGVAKALEVAYQNLDADQSYLQSLKNYFIDQLKTVIPEIRFNGNSANADKSLYTVLSVNLPSEPLNRSLIQLLDELEISVSGGSACSTGSRSHVLEAIGIKPGFDTVRFSFSKFNTFSEIDHVVSKLAAIYETVLA